MTSCPASRRARATILAPRSCPSRPGLPTTMRIGGVELVEIMDAGYPTGDPRHSLEVDLGSTSGDAAKNTASYPKRAVPCADAGTQMGGSRVSGSVTHPLQSSLAAPPPETSGASFMGNHRADHRGHSR